MELRSILGGAAPFTKNLRDFRNENLTVSKIQLSFNLGLFYRKNAVNFTPLFVFSILYGIP